MALTKYEKETILLTNNADEHWEIFTYNVTLQKRLRYFSEQYPKDCWLKSRNQEGGETYVIKKGRIAIRLIAPYSEERKQAASE